MKIALNFGVTFRNFKSLRTNYFFLNFARKGKRNFSSRFKPETIGLDPKFSLLNYSTLKG
jgi:hypothetical protein